MRPKLFRPLALLVLCIAAPLLGAGVARAEDVSTKLQATKDGQLPVDELARFIASSAESNELTPEEAHRALEEVPDLRPLLIEPTMTKFLAVVSAGSTKKAESLQALAKEVYAGDPSRLRRIEEFSKLAESADAMLETGKIKELLELATASNNPTEQSLLAPRLSRAVTALERQLLGAPDPFASLRELASYQKIVPNERLAGITEGLVQRIAAGNASGEWTLDDAGVAGLLRSGAQIRPSMKDPLATVFERRVRDLVTANDGSTIMRSYSTLLENRPDPNPVNDQLRLWVVLNADDGDVRQFALGRLEELRYAGAIGKVDQLRLMLRGYYGRGISIFLISSLIIVLLCAGLMALRPFFIQGVSEAIVHAETRNRQRAEQAAAAQAGPARSAERARGSGAQASAQAATARIKRPMLKREKYVPGYARGPVEKDEYTKLLEYLGLEDDASESAIKRAYRERVKSLHPDAKPGEVDTQDEAFIELKEVYDRILEIRGSWFGGRK